jgi:phage-related protein
VATRKGNIEFRGSSLDDISDFPETAKARAGFQLRRIQEGLEPNDWRPMDFVGKGVAEIKINTGDAFRIFYTATIGEIVYVLHAFQKKSRRTAKRDIELGQQRYRDLLRELQNQKRG